MVIYFRYEKERLDRQRVVEAAKGVGKPKVGGPFELVDQEGKKFTEEDMKGGYSLVSEIGDQLLQQRSRCCRGESRHFQDTTWHHGLGEGEPLVML